MSTVSSVSPNWAVIGSVVDVFGSGLSDASSVMIGRQAADFSVVDDTHLQATVPDGAGGLFLPVQVFTSGGVASGGLFTPLYVGDWQTRAPRTVQGGGWLGAAQGIQSPPGSLGARKSFDELCDYTGAGPSDNKNVNLPHLRYLQYPDSDPALFIGQAWIFMDMADALNGLTFDALPITPPNGFEVENEGFGVPNGGDGTFGSYSEALPFIDALSFDLTLDTDEGEWGPGGVFATFAPSTQVIEAWTIDPADYPSVDSAHVTSTAVFYGASTLTHPSGSVTVNASDTHVTFTTAPDPSLISPAGHLTLTLAYASQRSHTPPVYNTSERALNVTPTSQVSATYRQPRGRWLTYLPLPAVDANLAGGVVDSRVHFWRPRA